MTNEARFWVLANSCVIPIFAAVAAAPSSLWPWLRIAFGVLAVVYVGLNFMWVLKP